MMRRAFTLIELLVIIAIIGIMVTVSVLSIRAGQAAARMRGATRAVFCTIRQARSIALVTKQSSIITFSTKKIEGEVVSKAEITSARLMADRSLMTSAGRPPRSVDGYDTLPSEAEEAAPEDTRQAFVVSNRDGEEPKRSSEGEGHTVEEALFRPMDEELMAGVCIRVVMEDDEDDDGSGEVDEAKRSMVSTFSNVDALLGLYSKYREQKAEREAAADEEKGRSAAEVEVIEEERHVRWLSNGRADPHSVYVYAEGEDWEDGWCVKVDMFGATKVISDGEED